MRPLFLALFLLPAVALAAPPRIEISAPMLAFSRSGAWVPVHVDVAATEGFDGRVLIDFGGSIPQERTFTVPDNGRRRIRVPALVPESGYEVAVTVLSRGKLLASEVLPLPGRLDAAALRVAVVGESPLGWTVLRSTHAGPVEGHVGPTEYDERTVQVETLLPDQLPDTWFGWTSTDVAVWRRPDPAALTPAQQGALRAWVARGGSLLLGLGDEHAEWSASPLAGLVPAGDRGLVGSDSALMALGRAESSMLRSPVAAPEGALLVVRLDARAGVEVLLSDDEGRPLVLQNRVGAGRVVVLAFDPGAAELGALGGASLWRSLYGLWGPALAVEDPDLFDGIPPTEFDARPGLVGPSRAVLALRCDSSDLTGLSGLLASLGHDADQALSRCAEQQRQLISQRWTALQQSQIEFDAAAPLSLTFIIAFGLLYLIAIGPLDWLIIRRLDKPLWTWLTFPVLALAFAAAAALVVAQHKAGESESHCLAVVDLVPEAGVQVGGTACGFWSSDRRDRLAQAPPGTGWVKPADDGGGFIGDDVVTGSDLRLRGEPGRVGFSFESAQWAANLVETAWAQDDAGFVRWYATAEGSAVRNATGVDLREVHLWDGAQWFAVGSLRDGAARDVGRATEPVISLPATAGLIPGGPAQDLLAAALPGRPLLVGVAQSVGAPTVDGVRPASHETLLRVHLPPAPEAL